METVRYVVTLQYTLKSDYRWEMHLKVILIYFISTSHFSI